MVWLGASSDSHFLSFQCNTTVNAHDRMCKGGTFVLIASLCPGEALPGQHPGLRPGFQVTAIHGLAESPGDTLIWHWLSEWTLEGQSPKVKKEAFNPAQQCCPLLNPLPSAHRNVRTKYGVFTFLWAPFHPAYWRQGPCQETVKSFTSCFTKHPCHDKLHRQTLLFSITLGANAVNYFSLLSTERPW